MTTPAPTDETQRGPFTLNWSVVAVVALTLGVLGAGIGIGAAIWAGNTSTATNPTTLTAAPVSTGSISLLYVIESSGAYATVDAGRRSGTLVLTGISDSVLAFSDRPARLADSLKTSDFISAWTRNGFAGTPPNAALVVPDGPPGNRATALVLKAPAYDPQAGTVRFDVDALADQDVAWLFKLTQGSTQRNGRASLFIDNVSPDTGAALNGTPEQPTFNYDQMLQGLQQYVGGVKQELQAAQQQGTVPSNLGTMFQLQFRMQTLSQYIESISNTLSAVHNEMITMSRATKGS